jgi:hypothetical protein
VGCADSTPDMVPALKNLVTPKPREPLPVSLPDETELLVGVLDGKDTILRVRGVYIPFSEKEFVIQITDGVVQLWDATENKVVD